MFAQQMPIGDIVIVEEKDDRMATHVHAEVFCRSYSAMEGADVFQGEMRREAFRYFIGVICRAIIDDDHFELVGLKALPSQTLKRRFQKRSSV